MKYKVGDFKTSPQQRDVIMEILDNNWVTENVYVDLFERSVEKFLGVNHAIAVCNGTVSLQLIAHFTRMTNKDKKLTVCCPATTFPATLNAFLILGYEPILCEIDRNNLCMDIDKLTEEEKRKIDVIVPVSLLGYTPDMDKIMEQSSKYQWIVVEDFAESFGSTYKGKKLGSIGHMGSSSFFVSHVFQGGELGVVTTNRPIVADILRKMKNHGRDGSTLLFKHKYVGSNYKTTEFSAGLAWAQLQDADRIIKERQAIAKIYHDGITNSDLTPMPVSDDYSYLGYPILAKDEETRIKICKHLNKHGIETRGMFPCLANQEAYKGMFDSKKFPISVEMENRGFYIGVHSLIDNLGANYIVEKLNKK